LVQPLYNRLNKLYIIPIIYNLDVIYKENNKNLLI
jgi:hypothetical protein